MALSGTLGSKVVSACLLPTPVPVDPVPWQRQNEMFSWGLLALSWIPWTHPEVHAFDPAEPFDMSDSRNCALFVVYLSSDNVISTYVHERTSETVTLIEPCATMCLSKLESPKSQAIHYGEDRALARSENPHETYQVQVLQLTVPLSSKWPKLPKTN